MDTFSNIHNGGVRCRFLFELDQSWPTTGWLWSVWHETVGGIISSHPQRQRLILDSNSKFFLYFAFLSLAINYGHPRLTRVRRFYLWIHWHFEISFVISSYYSNLVCGVCVYYWSFPNVLTTIVEENEYWVHTNALIANITVSIGHTRTQPNHIFRN